MTVEHFEARAEAAAALRMLADRIERGEGVFDLGAEYDTRLVTESPYPGELRPERRLVDSGSRWSLVAYMPACAHPLDKRDKQLTSTGDEICGVCRQAVLR